MGACVMCIWAGKGQEGGGVMGGRPVPSNSQLSSGPWAREGGGAGSMWEGRGAGEWQLLCGNPGLGLTSIRYLLSPGIRGGLSHSQSWS